MNQTLTNPVLVLPDWSGQPAHQMLAPRFTGHTLPSVSASAELIVGDAIIALSADDALSRELAQRLTVSLDGLGDGAFAIVPQDRRLYVLGGNKRGLLHGLAELLNRAQVHKGVLTWSAGEMRETPALPLNYYWTWDHSTNWWLMADGQQETGCNNHYTKTADDFIRDYKLLIDHCVRTRVGGIVIWGFIRDAHGGIAASQEICRYAADRGIRILPGVGTSVYGGVYYGSDDSTDTTAHPLNAKCFVRTHPKAGLVEESGSLSTLYPCPTHPSTINWLKQCADWLFSTFEIGGVNVEHGDFIVCYCDRCTAARKDQRQAGYFSTMQLANTPFIDQALRIKPDAWITYATYTGFAPDPSPERGYLPPRTWHTAEPWRIHGADPEFAHDLDPRSICQWTLTRMVNQQQRPLAEWLDNGQPASMLHNDHWPADHQPPTRRNVGFIHQGSQWSSQGVYLKGLPCDRYSLQISCIKEACLRASRANITGVSIHGEVSNRCIPYSLNYLAHTYFSYHPEASLRQFGRDVLSPILTDGLSDNAHGSASEGNARSDAKDNSGKNVEDGKSVGEQFVEWLARAEPGNCTADELKKIEEFFLAAIRRTATRSASVTPARYWRWLRFAAEPGQWVAAQVFQISA
ncbi:MAG: hypothetical protein IT444_06855 [Phycisphaeraceae bacterium]|nr:hypothetical protein [Phycisphaeraceae bacterium]